MFHPTFSPPLRTAALIVFASLVAACSPRSESSPPAAASADGVATDLGGRRVVVALENGYVPFNYIDPATGQTVGWDYDAIGELARRLNFQPDYREIAWDSLIQGVATGQFDLAANGITITAERARVVDFSSGYMSVRQRLLLRADETRFDSLESFAVQTEVLFQR